MDRPRRSPGPGVKVKKKMTKEQVQLAIIKKKECDAKALTIVERLLEPQVDPRWLVENLKDINKCHMEDAIEERAITKLCGYVLCQKPLTVVINQKYHISLKSKKVYDVTKRKNFCSSSCFGASNYLLEQMLTSPLWLRDQEKIPKFRIFSNDKSLTSSVTHGEEVDINIIQHCSKDDEQTDKKPEGEILGTQLEVSEEREIATNVEDLVLDAVKNMKFHGTNSNGSLEIPTFEDNVTLDKELDVDTQEIKNFSENNNSINNESDIIEQSVHFVTKVENKTVDVPSTKQNTNNCENLEKDDSTLDINMTKKIEDISVNNGMKHNVTDIIEQHVYSLEQIKDKANYKQNINLQNTSNSENVEKNRSSDCDKILQNNANKNTETFKNNIVHEKLEKQTSGLSQKSNLHVGHKDKKSEKSKHTKKKTQVERKVDTNLAARVESSFQEWITEETIHFLFGDDSIKQKTIEKIEQQDKYSILCQKLNKLQFQDEQVDIETLEKPTLKPAPHFAVLQEEGQKLELKVRAYYEGKTAIEETKKSIDKGETAGSETYLPLTDVHAPQTLRRKIFLDRLDQVLPDLLKTLAGNNEMYARTTFNYTSVRCTAVKALVHTFSLSSKNIIFKTAEWTLVGLVIIKMLSLLDPWLTTLLSSKQANMYISMILTSYKLDPHYLNLLVASFNPNMNPR